MTTNNNIDPNSDLPEDLNAMGGRADPTPPTARPIAPVREPQTDTLGDVERVVILLERALPTVQAFILGIRQAFTMRDAARNAAPMPAPAVDPANSPDLVEFVRPETVRAALGDATQYLAAFSKVSVGEMLKQIEGNEDQLAVFVTDRINSGAYSGAYSDPESEIENAESTD